MYYNGSPKTEEAYKNATNGTTGTHTGNLYWNPNTSSWRVAHNINGTLHDDDFKEIQGVRKGKSQYGITAIGEAPTIYDIWQKDHPIKSKINNFVGKLGINLGRWKNGGILKAQNGITLPDIIVTGININKHSGNPWHRQFLRSLNNNRKQFMNQYNLSDNEYADLTKKALNLSSFESDRGRSSSVFKKTFIYPDWLIHAGKIIKRGKDSANSRGITQIKYNDDIKIPELNKIYTNLGITDHNLKYNASTMGRATLGRLLWVKNQLKGKSLHYTDGTKIPDEIATYLYWNRGKVTDRANGNPETGSHIGAADQINYYIKNKIL